MTFEGLNDNIKLKRNEISEHQIVIHAYAQEILENIKEKYRPDNEDLIEFVSVLPNELINKLDSLHEKGMEVLDYIWNKMFSEYKIEINQTLDPDGTYKMTVLDKVKLLRKKFKYEKDDDFSGIWWQKYKIPEDSTTEEIKYFLEHCLSGYVYNIDYKENYEPGWYYIVEAGWSDNINRFTTYEIVKGSEDIFKRLQDLEDEYRNGLKTVVEQRNDFEKKLKED